MSKGLKLIFIGLLIVSLGALSASGYFYWTSKKLKQANEEKSQSATVGKTTTKKPNTVETGKQVLAEKIEWLASPKIVENLPIFKERDTGTKTYEVGQIKKDKYVDYKLYIVDSPKVDGLGDDFYYIASNGQKFVILSRHSSKAYEGDKLTGANIVWDADYRIPDLEFPKEISAPNGAKLKIAQPLFPAPLTFFSLENLTVAFEDKKYGTFYMEERPDASNARGGFYVRRPDGIRVDYELVIPFINKEGTPLITWSDGSKNKDKYNYVKLGGCGAINYAHVVNIHLAELKSIGKTAQGDPVYSFKDPNHNRLKYYYENEYDKPYDGEKVSYEEFVASRPIFYWKDPFGRLIEFHNDKFTINAECGKPVIYLYPEKEKKVIVKLNVKNGLTYTEPKYNNGWEVLASPSGILKNIRDGKIYPYLFWEGRGDIYETPKEGFVIKKAELKKFLDSALFQLGLNTQEINDFEEFWLPRMNEAPYYKISFIPQDEIDKLAPLTIEPKPDKIIRILMDYEPLSFPISLQEQRLPKIRPERRGFTVVEWGGVLR